MWPFHTKPNLRELSGPTSIDVVTRVTSANEARSPVSQLMAAFVHVEVIERTHLGMQSAEMYESVSLGEAIFGNLVTLKIESGVGDDGDGDEDDPNYAVDIVARRARLHFVNTRSSATPMSITIPELVPFLSRARGGGVLCYREHLVLHGDRLRLRAIVERVSQVVTSGYRSDVAERLVVRDDLAPVLLDEVLDAADF